MKISLNWLNRYTTLSKSPKELEEALTLIGFEVEGIETTGLPDLPLVVVGEILSSEQHPNADKLSVCQVRTSLSEDPRQIVCGAKNYKVGDRVPVALPGTVLGENFTIKESKLRGVLSQGMMCSAKELGLGADHAGLLILESRPEIGTPINSVFSGGDVIFDIEVTPNRPDCLSHLGIARELAAYFGLELRYPELKCNVSGPFREAHPYLLKGVTSTTDNCPHYLGYSIRGVKVGPSPDWLKNALESVGLRPINNVVDVTNFVVHELGQPLHAFDAGKLAGPEIIVRQANDGEKFVTLDNKERVLDSRMTVIADSEKAVALAGVMGGLYSEVDNGTADVLLEAAWFHPPSIRYTARKLGLSTDASYRYERGCDPLGVEFAALRAIDLILETAGGHVCGPAQAYGEPRYLPREIELSPDFINKTLGFTIPDPEIKRVLEALELDVTEHEPATDGERRWTVGIPSFRLDLDRPVDLVEETLRIYGTEKIPPATLSAPGLVSEDDPIPQYLRKATAYLVNRGACECIHYTMRPPEETKEWYAHAGEVALANPLASDQSHLRPSLIPGLLDALRVNTNRRNDPRFLFETGRVFRQWEGKIWELVSVAFVMPVSSETKSWLPRENPDFYTATQHVQELLRLSGLGTAGLTPEPLTDAKPWQKGHSAKIGNIAQRGYAAEFGTLNLNMSKAWDAHGPVLAGEITFLPSFLQKGASRKRYTAVSAFPDTTRDLALVMDTSTPAETARSVLEKAARQSVSNTFALEEVRVFDVYSGTGLPEGKKSIAFGLRFRASDRTLTDDEVNKVFADVQKRIVSGGAYTIRA